MGLGVCFIITLRRLIIIPQSDDINPSCDRGRVLRLIACWESVMRLPPRTHVKSDQYWPASETLSEWRIAGGPKVVRDRMLTESWYAATVHATDHIQYRTNRTTGPTTSRNTV